MYRHDLRCRMRTDCQSRVISCTAASKSLLMMKKYAFSHHGQMVLDTHHPHGKNMPKNTKKELAHEIIKLAPRLEIRDNTHPQITHMYGQSVKMARKSGFGLGGRFLALGRVVVMMQLAIKSNPIFRKANARTPQAKPVEPFKRWFNMMGNITPPSDVPLSAVSMEWKLRVISSGGFTDSYRTHSKGSPLLPMVCLNGECWE